MKAMFNENEFDFENFENEQSKDNFFKNVLNFTSNIFKKIIAIKNNKILKMLIYTYQRITSILFTFILILVLSLIYSNINSNQKIFTNKEIKSKINNYAMILNLKNKIAIEKKSLLTNENKLKEAELKKIF